MRGRTLTLFEVFGIKIKLDWGWALIAAFIGWSLARGVFPELYEGLDPQAYWWMALVSILGLGASIVLHELAHSLVARAFGLPLHSITLFIFGGVAELEEEPHSPTAELLMALAGPATSFALALGFSAIAAVGQAAGRPALAGVFDYLALLNLVLAVFNMIPAFPLDGGRALRAILWAVRRDYGFATRTAARLGVWFGVALMASGLLAALSGAFSTGLWWILIGLFLQGAAQSERLHDEAVRGLKGRPVRELMSADPDVVAPELSLRRFVEDHLNRLRSDLFRVAEDGRPIAVIGVKEAKAVPRDRWDEVTVGEVATPIPDAAVIDASADGLEALEQMQRTRRSTLFVMEGGRLAGVLGLKDLLDMVSIRAALESR